MLPLINISVMKRMIEVSESLSFYFSSFSVTSGMFFFKRCVQLLREKSSQIVTKLTSKIVV